jgi:UPF0716 protein FxsA
MGQERKMAEFRFVRFNLQSQGSPMRAPAHIVLYLGLWLLAEFAVFSLVVHVVGFFGAILLCLLTSIAGAAMLRNVGLSAAMNLRRGLVSRSDEDNSAARDAMFDGALAGLGSILLILPGFVSDFFGFALAAPSIRSQLAAWLQSKPVQSGHRHAAPKEIELAPQEWTRLDDQNPRSGSRK